MFKMCNCGNLMTYKRRENRHNYIAIFWQCDLCHRRRTTYHFYEDEDEDNIFGEV